MAKVKISEKKVTFPLSDIEFLIKDLKSLCDRMVHCSDKCFKAVYFVNDKRVKKKKIYFDKENHDIEKTNTETFMTMTMK